MATFYKINGKEVSREEWKALRHELPQTEETTTAFSDNELTEIELNTIMDGDKNGRFSFDDFKEWRLSRFDNVARILSHYGFDVDKKLLGQSKSFIDQIPKKFWSSKEIVLAVVKQDGPSLHFADPRLKANREIVLAAVKQDIWAFKFADPALKKNIPFLIQLAQANISVLENFALPVQNSVWRNLAKTKDWSDVLPKETLQNYSRFRRALKEIYNIEFIKRFRSPKTIHAVLAARSHPEAAPSKPLAVANYPKVDWNGSLARYPLIDRLIELGYHVFYYEAEKEEDVKKALAEATQNGGRKADLIVLAGHGTETTLSLGEEGINDELHYVDTSDFEKPTPDIPLPSFIQPDGHLILYSCSNGQGREANPNNLANTIVRHLPKNVTIHAPDRRAHIVDVSIDPDDQLTVRWDTKESLYAPNGKVIK